MFLAIEATHANKEQRTGVEQVCWHLINNLKKEIPSDWRVVLYSNKPLLGRLADLPANWSTKILSWPLKKGWSQTRLFYQLWRDRPDIFLAPGQLVPIFCPFKTITIIHDCAWKAFPQAYGLLSRIYLERMNKLIVKNSHLIITPTEFGRQELHQYYKFPLEKIKVIPWGFDANKFKPAKFELSRFEKFKINQPYLLFVGRLEEKKNVNGIIKAFEILRSQYRRDLDLVLVGRPGVGYEQINQLINKSLFKKNIIKLGWVKEDDLPILYSSAQAFVFPSLYEGFGLPILEAMACGCPVVTARQNSLLEVGGQSAIYIDNSDPAQMARKIEELLAKSDLRQQMINSGLKTAKLFSWQKTAQALTLLLSKQV